MGGRENPSLVMDKRSEPPYANILVFRPKCLRNRRFLSKNPGKPPVKGIFPLFYGRGGPYRNLPYYKCTTLLEKLQD
jgi:hypothetical protein